MTKENLKISPELKEIIVYRLKSSKLPENIKLSIGNLSKEPMSTEEMIKHVESEDDVGKKIMEIELFYLQALKRGIVSQPEK